MNIDSEIRSLHKQGYSRYEIFKNLATDETDRDQLYIRILPFLEQDIYKRALLISVSIVAILVFLGYHFLFHITSLPQVIQRMTFYEMSDWIRLFQFIVMGIVTLIGIRGLLQCRPRFYFMLLVLSGSLLFIVPLITTIAIVASDIPANAAALIIWNIGAITLFILSFVGKRLTAPFVTFSSFIDKKGHSYRRRGYRFRR